ncbi:hypothetical protein T484DRAFT_1819135 [Baffinella frigidus]|nr:hypothetical protein T484DRAFT_1819135 [Cryptophyta sp. CCMP2293]
MAWGQLQSLSLPLVRVDCADGVGAASIAAFAPMVADLLPIEAFNTGGAGEQLNKGGGGRAAEQGVRGGAWGAGAQLNKGCGAEHVQKERALPRGVDTTAAAPGAGGGNVYASLDGDADRVVLFFVKDGEMELLDGDKIAVLLAAFVARCLEETKLALSLAVIQDRYRWFIARCLEEIGLALSLAVIQTSYANGAATRYLQANVPRATLACVATGVKHLHHRALDFDIGVYFEANGHGTVLFSPAARTAISAAAASPDAPLAGRMRLLAA